MQLAELDPTFLARVDGRTYHRVDRATADGLLFLCPVCYVRNAGAAGTHSVLCWQPHVPIDVSPGPGRWRFDGDGIADLTLVGVPTSSVRLQGGCQAHFYVRAGAIVDA